MVESVEELETETEEALQQASPAAVSIALARASRGRSGKALDAKAEAFLDKHTRLIELQTEHLHEQRELQLAHLKVRGWKDRLSLALQALGVIGGAAVFVAVAAMAWQAHEDHGVSIEAFSVPPDLAQRELTGQVVASQLLDRLAGLQARTITTRPASTYANDWGGDIKVEIPETGVSIGELSRYLRQWLSSETRIAGEVTRTPTGLAITARAGGAPGSTFRGGDADLDLVTEQAAEAIYSQTQPYRYAVYLQSSGRTVAAERAYARLASAGTEEDRAWALSGWGSLLLSRGDLAGAADKGKQAVEAAPGMAAGYVVAFNGEALPGHNEEALALARRADRSLQGGERNLFPPEVSKEMLGDYRGMLQMLNRRKRLGSINSEGRAGVVRTQLIEAVDTAQDHEISRALALISRMPYDAGPINRGGAEAVIYAAAEDWPAVIQASRDGVSGLGALPTAEAYARLGRVQQARSSLNLSDPRCVPCAISAGVIAAAAGEAASADRWFSKATQLAPSLPAAPTAWGRALLERGDIDRALVMLRTAHRLSPHFADALELWGEVLTAKRDYAGAVGKFHEADEYAPRWGRNHLRWGQALMLSGRYAEARAQYVAANGMDLSAPDRAALNVLLARTASGPLHG